MDNTYAILKKSFGFEQFRQNQKEIIDTIVKGGNCLVLMPTGGGKSLCYQVPALLLNGTALVISPLIALMKDQVSNLQANGIPAAFINSSLSRDKESQNTKAFLEGKLKLLYISPERALTLDASIITIQKISLLAIDEAHCISQWGHDFRPEYARLKNIRKHLPGVPVIALTATADKTTRNDIITQLEIGNAPVFISSFDRPNIRLEVQSGLRYRQKLLKIADFIKKRKEFSGIIYCQSRKNTEFVASWLQQQGFTCGFYHAGMTTSDRTRIQEAFVNDDIKIICATIAFGMGIDKSNIRYVIHYNLPSKIESYYQEIGRSGRDGTPAEALMFYNVSDLTLWKKFAVESGKPELNLAKLRQMQHYAEATMCRRRILLNYFGENLHNNCNHCDACSNPGPVQDVTTAAQKALSAALRTGEQTGLPALINILKGSNNVHIIEKGYHKIKTFGQGKEFTYEKWLRLITQFIQLGLFELAYDDNFTLKVTEQGFAVLKNKQAVLVSDPAYVDQPSEDMHTGSEAIGYRGKLLKELLDLRKEIAGRRQIPPYTIFSDRTLIEMASKKPKNIRQMHEITGLSHYKIEQYATPFLNLINHRVKNKTEIVEHLTFEKVKAFADEMATNRVAVSATSITRVLLGTAVNRGSNQVESLSFHSLLKGRIRHKKLFDIIKSKLIPVKPSLNNPVTENFFDSEKFNLLATHDIKTISQMIQNIPVNRITESIDNNFILEQRKDYPRSYEPWLQPEADLFAMIIEKTNDLGTIAEIFGRSPYSIRSYFKKNFPDKSRAVASMV